MAEYSTKHIGGLMRSDLDELAGRIDQRPGSGDLFLPDPSSVKLIEVTALSRFWEGEKAPQSGKEPKPFQYRTKDVLNGLCGASVPVVYGLLGTPTRIRVILGTADVPESGRAPDRFGQAARIIWQTLPGQYPGIEQKPLEGPEAAAIPEMLRRYRHFGLLTGIPTNKTAEEEEDPTQADRLIRSMFGTEWGLLTIARPIPAAQSAGYLNQVINEMRAVENSEQTKQRRSPLAETYFKQLELLQEEHLTARATGLWLTCVYYFASDEETFQHLGAAARACYGGSESKPEPVRTLQCDELADAVSRFGQLVTANESGPGLVQAPLRYQTLLNSERLSAIVHLPRHEMPGYLVKENSRFDVAPHHSPEEAPIELGEILNRGRPMGNHYRLSPQALNKHMLVVGVTGSGKTNTTFHLLGRLRELGTPFLVIEPAKTEYRALLAHEAIGPELQVFTLGDENTSPFRLNPFEVEAGVSVATHIDLLKATFNASFAMWSPLPQVLERCIHAVYRDAGWDTVRNTNRRLESPWESSIGSCPEAFPTLTGLYDKVEEVVTQLGYEDRVTSDIKAALSTRLHSLRIGGKGVMLDTARSLPMERLLSRPTVIELEQIGDDDEKSFVMGLLLMKLYEYHRARGIAEGSGLKHVVVIEEAHRLLANVAQNNSEDSSNVKGKAVETFVNMLSEVRAYGQGFFVAEQIPGKLAPDVLKNTNLKVVHRTVAGDDREVLARTMNMTDKQSNMLTTLQAGRAAVFSEGDDRPIMIRVPYAKFSSLPEAASKAGSDRLVRTRMAPFRMDPETAPLFVPFSACPESQSWPGELTDFAGLMIEKAGFRELFSAFVLAALESPGACAGSMARLEKHTASMAPQYALGRDAFACVLVHAIRWYVSRFGSRLEWPYPTAARLTELLTKIALGASGYGAAPDDRDPVIPPDLLEEFRQVYFDACAGLRDPLTSSGRLSPSREVIYRYHTEPLLQDRELNELFDLGMAAAAGEEGWEDLRAVDQALARLGAFDLPPEAQEGIARAYGAQQIAFKPGLLQIARDLAWERFESAIEQRRDLPLSGDGDDESAGSGLPTDRGD